MRLILCGLVFITFTVASCGRLEDLQKEIAEQTKTNGVNEITQEIPKTTSVSDEELQDIVDRAMATPGIGEIYRLETQFIPDEKNAQVVGQAHFLKPRELEIPRYVYTKEPISNTQWVEFSFKNEKESVSCFYRSTTSASRLCQHTKAPSKLSFSYCVNEEISKKFECYLNPLNKNCIKSQYVLPLSFKQTKTTSNTITTSAVSLRVPDLNTKCSLSYAYMDFKVLGKKEDITCDVRSSDLTLSQDLDCSGEKEVGLVLRGDDLVLDGKQYFISAKNAKIGLLILGDRHRIQDIKINGSLYGVGTLAFSNNGLRFSGMELENRWVGFDLVHQISYPEMVENQFKGFFLEKIRKR